MKAAVLYHPGEPENFSVETRPIPVPGEEQVLIKVKAFGLNRSELMTRKGLSPNVIFPRILGIECVGEIEFDPSGEYQKGEKVMALMGGMGRNFDGSYAEFTILPKSIVHSFYSTLPWETLGAIPEMYQTVYGSLHLALKIKNEETLLIRGGTSSVGMLATQIARNIGLRVLATTRNMQKEKLLLENGASYALIDDGNLRNKVRAIFPGGIDKVLELVGAITLKDSLECLKPGGTGCMAGMLSENWYVKNFEPMEFIPSTVNLTIYDSGQTQSPARIFQEFIHTVEAGKIKLNVSKVFALKEIAEAHKFMESNQGAGKIVVVT